MRRSKHFTIIELLVVVSVLGILVSMLQPSLSRTYELAKSQECKLQMGQIHTAIQLYITDEGGVLPGPFFAGQSARLGRNNRAYENKLNGYLMPYFQTKVNSEGFMYQDEFFCPNVRASDELVIEETRRFNYYIPHRNSVQGGTLFGFPEWKGRAAIEPIAAASLVNPATTNYMLDADSQMMTWVACCLYSRVPNAMRKPIEIIFSSMAISNEEIGLLRIFTFFFFLFLLGLRSGNFPPLTVLR